MTTARVRVDTAHGRRIVAPLDYLGPSEEEAAVESSLAWIKSLRHAVVDDQPFRRRFTFRGDSLWWFAELYLHKQQVVLDIFRTIAALETLIARERPTAMAIASGGRVLHTVAPQIAEATGCRFRRRWQDGWGGGRRAALSARAAWLHYSALASRVRRRSAPLPNRAPVAAFIHRAFWRSDAADGSAESYIGPVLDALERRAPAASLAYVSVGPSSNFRARRWWHPLAGTTNAATAPVDAYAPPSNLVASRQMWRDRHRLRRAMWNSADLRRLAVIKGCDCWSVIREELAGIALLQWPWSTRTMDEAGAALDALRPSVVVTYAEAGGWGRALVLESRRRGIPTVGLQHGFIFRHWLNYRHEPDEMLPDPGHQADRGFPRPTRTLLFDEYAARHLETAGRFPPDSLEVTGSPRLDALVEAIGRVTLPDIDAARAQAGATPGETILLVAAKYREARGVLEPLADTAGTMTGLRVAIKTHPAETPEVYAPVARGRPHVTVLPASAPLAPLLAAARAVATVNSTVALDAAVVDVPTLVLGLPNNLSPFVDAGLMAGAGAGDLRGALQHILYDEEFRQRLAQVRREFLARYRIGSTGDAAARSAEAILRVGGAGAAPRRAGPP